MRIIRVLRCIDCPDFEPDYGIAGQDYCPVAEQYEEDFDEDPEVTVQSWCPLEEEAE